MSQSVPRKDRAHAGLILALFGLLLAATGASLHHERSLIAAESGVATGLLTRELQNNIFASPPSGSELVTPPMGQPRFVAMTSRPPAYSVPPANIAMRPQPLPFVPGTTIADAPQTTDIIALGADSPGSSSQDGRLRLANFNPPGGSGSSSGGSIVNSPIAGSSSGGTSTGGTSSGNTSTGGSSSGGSVTPVTGVPEPSSWALMILGFGAIGVAIRRRAARLRKSQAFAV